VPTAKKRVRTEEQKRIRREKRRANISAEKAYEAAYRQKNREKIRAKQRAKYHENKEASAAAAAERRKKNPEITKRAQQNYAARHPERLIASRKKYRDKDPEKCRAYLREWRRTHKESGRRSERKQYATNPKRKMRITLGTRLYQVLRKYRTTKCAPTMTLAGCTTEFLVQYLQSKFQPGMSWDNYGHGKGKWNVDHIRPCASFDLTDPEQQRQCFHFSNLQPLWHEENMAKSDKIAA